MDGPAAIAEQNRQLQATWREAAADLGIEVEDFKDRTLVKNFGGRGGTITGIGHWEQMQREAKPLGAGFSNLSTGYCEYARATYVDLLNDWGWSGDGDPPEWYTDLDANDSAS